MAQLTQTEKRSVGPEQGTAKRSESLLLLKPIAHPRFLPLWRPAPHGLSASHVNAGERGIGFVAPVKAVEIAVAINRGVPMQPEFRICPSHFVVAVWQNIHQCASRLIASRDKHLIVDSHRTGSVDRFIAAAAPRKLTIDRTSSRVDAQQASCRRLALTACKHQQTTLPLHDGWHGRSITCAPKITGAPQHLAGALVKRRYTRASRSPHIDDQQICLDDGRRGHSEKILRY